MKEDFSAMPSSEVVPVHRTARADYFIQGEIQVCQFPGSSADAGEALVVSCGNQEVGAVCMTCGWECSYFCNMFSRRSNWSRSCAASFVGLENNLIRFGGTDSRNLEGTDAAWGNLRSLLQKMYQLLEIVGLT